MELIEVIALIFALVSIIKIIFVVYNKKFWYEKVVEKVYGNPNISSYVLVVIGILLFYLLLQEISIVQVFVSLIFASVFMGLGFLQYSEELKHLLKKIYSRNLSSWQLFYVLIWIMFVLFVVYEILLN